jgi:AcrR family transcriptional regulator
MVRSGGERALERSCKGATVTDILQGPALLPEHEDLTDARRRLFTAALALFGDRGYHAVSVKDLMQSLGQQPGALYGHVESKQQLLYELIRIGTEFHRTRIQRALLEAGTEPADQVRAIVEAHVRVHLEHRELARVTSREIRSLTEEQQDRLAVARQEAIRMFEEVIDRGVRVGEFTVGSRSLALNAIASMGIRAAEWWTPDLPEGVDEIATTFAEYAVKVLR